MVDVFGAPNYFGELYRDFLRLSRLCLDGDVVAYGRRCLSCPHHSDRKKKGGKAKAKRRVWNKRRRKR